MKEIYLAGGCFWGTEHYMKQIAGVTETQTGYANSRVENPSYQQVRSGATGAAETVRVVYDPKIVPLSFLLQLYFETIDPLAVNHQGEDYGTQYRTGIFFTELEDLMEIQKVVNQIENQCGQALAVEVKPIENFYPAEDYHQDYLDKNPEGYCHIPAALFLRARKARP